MSFRIVFVIDACHEADNRINDPCRDGLVSNFSFSSGNHI